jgi:hypothetical protein
MRRQSRYLIGVAGLAAATLSFIVCLEVAEIATALPSAALNHPIDRTLKGDRLLLIPRPSVAPAIPARVPEGCESSVSEIHNPSAHQAVGRCLAAAPSLSRAATFG